MLLPSQFGRVRTYVRAFVLPASQGGKAVVRLHEWPRSERKCEDRWVVNMSQKRFSAFPPERHLVLEVPCLLIVAQTVLPL